mgnify:CR=1 FL=1
MSFDELFIHCYGEYSQIVDKEDLEANSQLKLLNQVDTLFETLWSYVNFSGQGLEPDKNLVVGVYDRANNIFETHGYQATINGWSHYNYISLGDPDRIAFMLMETAIPAFKLMGVDAWANEFTQKRNEVYTFSDKRLEDIDMIMPGMHDEAEIAWAYGWLFGYVCNPRGNRGLRVKPSATYRDKHNLDMPDEYYDYFNITDKSDIYKCHQKFINDIELSRDILNRAMNDLGQNQVAIVGKILEWVNYGKMKSPEIRGKLWGSMKPKERQVILNEVKYLKMRFNRLQGFNLDVADNGNVTYNSGVSPELEKIVEKLKKKYPQKDDSIESEE